MTLGKLGQDPAGAAAAAAAAAAAGADQMETGALFLLRATNAASGAGSDVWS